MGNGGKGPNITDNQLTSVVIGRTVNVTNHVVDIHTGDDDTSVRSQIALPTGFEIVGQPEPLIHRQREAKIWIDKTTQPGYVGVFSNQQIDIKGQIENIVDAEDDKKKKSALSALMVSVSNARMVDMSTHATIHYGFHIEGHKYGRDGYLSASLVYTLLRVPQPKDYSGVFASIAQAVLTDDNEEFKSAVGLLKELLSLSK